MNSRERVEAALAHSEPDRVPIDLGATSVTGAHVSIIAGLRQALGLDEAGTPVKVSGPYQMLGEVGDDLRAALGVDTVRMGTRGTMFGFRSESWEPWVTFDGTPVLVPGNFNIEPDENGDILQYPQGDKSLPPSARMPKGGFYFDAIPRQAPIDDANLNVEDNLEEFTRLPDEELEVLREKVKRLYDETDYAIVGQFGGMTFGDVALVPAPWLAHPKGIRDVAEWYMSTIIRHDYVREVFERQCEIALGNLALIHEAVGERLSVIVTSSTDFGAQNGPFISPDAYRDLFLPFSKRINDWIHKYTTWKTFIHSCGAVAPLVPSFIDAGFDILNPVQTSAAGMDPKLLKEKFGKDIVFWGGLVDTQHTLPFGTKEEVAAEVAERLEIFGADGGFVANAIHNVQAGVPIENVLEMFRMVREG
ncbi:MAG: methyltransferase [Planctomycetes bacterium]|nr:methyltransferase [Planctomycetota bacterium]